MIFFIIIFVAVLTGIIGDIYKKLNDSQLRAYLRESQLKSADNLLVGEHNYNAVMAYYIIKKEDNGKISYIRKDGRQPIRLSGRKDLIDDKAGIKAEFLNKVETISDVITRGDNIKKIKEARSINYDNLFDYNKVNYTIIKGKKYLRQIEINYNEKEPDLFWVWIAYTDDAYEKDEKRKAIYTFNILLVALFTLSNLIMFFWMRYKIVERIKKLSFEVESFPKHNYLRPIRITGRDEITDLMVSTDKLRSEISINEIRKREILQNISHDIKNPIGIVLSYAIAIKDGVADTSDINKIIQHSEVLQKRIKQLIEFVKAEYISRDNTEFEAINVKSVIKDLINDNKFRFDGSFITNLDNSKYYGDREKFSIAIQNIIENSIRFAKTKIEINLNQKRLTISNDGPKFNNGEEDTIFNIYEKSTKGQFGIGLSITKATLVNMNLDIVAKNLEDAPGVIFIIEPI